MYSSPCCVTRKRQAAPGKTASLAVAGVAVAALTASGRKAEHLDPKTSEMILRHVTSKEGGPERAACLCQPVPIS